MLGGAQILCGRLTHIEDEEEPAPVDEDDGAGYHGHQPGCCHADHPGEERREGAEAQPGAETS